MRPMSRALHWSSMADGPPLPRAPCEASPLGPADLQGRRLLVLQQRGTRLAIFGRELVDVCVKFHAAGVIIGVTGDGRQRGTEFGRCLRLVRGSERDEEPV